MWNGERVRKDNGPFQDAGAHLLPRSARWDAVSLSDKSFIFIYSIFQRTYLLFALGNGIIEMMNRCHSSETNITGDLNEFFILQGSVHGAGAAAVVSKEMVDERYCDLCENSSWQVHSFRTKRSICNFPMHVSQKIVVSLLGWRGTKFEHEENQV